MDGRCEAYGVGGIMRMPTRLKISWQDDLTLKIETDAGQQTRLFHFGTPLQTPAEDWQGSSKAEWDRGNAGAGGLFTASRLAHRGYRTLVVERLDKVGGRASTDDIDGFKVNNGAIVIEVGGITQRTFEEVGAPFDIREPSPPILYRIGGAKKPETRVRRIEQFVAMLTRGETIYPQRSSDR